MFGKVVGYTTTFLMKNVLYLFTPKISEKNKYYSAFHVKYLPLFAISLSRIRLVYEYCVKGQDLHIWYGLYQTENETSSGISRTEEMSMIINDFLSKHIKEHVSEVNF